MAHEIESTDGIVLHRQPAWHGLGIVVEDAPTPREALTLAGLDWGIEQRPLLVEMGYDSQTDRTMYDGIDSHVANFRADTGQLLGVVTKGYQPVTNFDMAEFAEVLADQNTVKCETAGSLRSGKRVWFLLKGEPFQVARADGMYPYILISNGHDGSAAFRVTPTTIRVVCSNTLHAVLPHGDKGELQSSAIAIRHTVNVMTRIEDAKNALKHYSEAIEAAKQMAGKLSAKDVSREDVQQFFVECYTADFGAIAANPKDKKEQRHRDKATGAYNSFTRRFDDEKGIAGTTLWNVANAYTGMIQHDLKARGKDDADRINKRADSNLFGLNQKRTAAAMQVAYRMAN